MNKNNIGSFTSTSDSFIARNINSYVFISQGEISEIEEKQYTFKDPKTFFDEKIVTYSILTLKNVIIAPQNYQQKKEKIKLLKVRINEKNSKIFEFRKGDVIHFLGKLIKDDFMGFLVRYVHRLGHGPIEKLAIAKKCFTDSSQKNATAPKHTVQISLMSNFMTSKSERVKRNSKKVTRNIQTLKDYL